jgi:hypothetical protein
MAAADNAQFRVGISYASFTPVGRNDASAAMKAWAQSVIKEQQITMAVTTEIIDDVNTLKEKIAKKELEGASMSTVEFIQLDKKPEFVYLVSKQGLFTEKYVLLTHSGSGISKLEDLKGKRFTRHLSLKTSMAEPWLETLLESQNLGSKKLFFSEETTNENPSKVILRVFFKQSDVCLVTASAYEIACEMNSQVRTILKPLIYSKALVPSLFFFVPDNTSKNLNYFESAVQNVHKSTAGLQLLTVFQGDRILKKPVSVLDESMQLLMEYEKIRSREGLSSEKQKEDR